MLSDEMGKVCPAYHYQSRPVRQILMEGRHGMFERVLTRCSADVHHDTRKGIAEGHAGTCLQVVAVLYGTGKKPAVTCSTAVRASMSDMRFACPDR